MKKYTIIPVLIAIGLATFFSVARAAHATDDGALPAAASAPIEPAQPQQATPPAQTNAMAPSQSVAPVAQAPAAQAQSPSQSASQVQGTPGKPGSVPRTKDLRFDEAVVEGMNNSSKDSLENSESRKNGNNKHLYQKRSSYRPEMERFPSSLEHAP